MTIDEAIEILWEMKRQYKYTPIPGGQGALTLGIEAQKAWKRGRQKYGWFYYPLLPEETED